MTRIKLVFCSVVVAEGSGKLVLVTLRTLMVLSFLESLRKKVRSKVISGLKLFSNGCLFCEFKNTNSKSKYRVVNANFIHMEKHFTFWSCICLTTFTSQDSLRRHVKSSNCIRQYSTQSHIPCSGFSVDLKGYALLKEYVFRTFSFALEPKIKPPTTFEITSVDKFPLAMWNFSVRAIKKVRVLTQPSFTFPCVESVNELASCSFADFAFMHSFPPLSLSNFFIKSKDSSPLVSTHSSQSVFPCEQSRC